MGMTAMPQPALALGFERSKERRREGRKRK
jgi:hypothetical protein